MPQGDYEAFVEQANEGMLIVDPDLNLTYANKAFLALMGYAPEDVLGRPVTSFMDMGAAHKVERERDRRREGTSSHYEVEVTTAAGEHRILHVAASPRLGPNGEFCGSFCIVNDITENIALKQQLQDYAHNLEEMVSARTDALIASEARYQEVFESVSDGILRVDRSGVVLLCNQALADMLGTTPGDLMGRNMITLVHEDDVDLVTDASRKSLRGDPMPPTQIYRLRRLDDPERIVYIETSASVTHREGKIDSIQILARDVTERVRAEEALKRAYAELKALSQAKTNFLSNVTHELKTPLVTIRGYAQMLEGGSIGPVSDEQRKALQISLKNTDVLLAQIERLLAITRLELDDTGLRCGAVLVSDMLEGCRADAFPLADQKGLDLRVLPVPEDLPPVWVDWEKISEVLGHLVVNAIKFTAKGGRIALSARATEDGAVRIAVRDTGVGVEPERIAKLFEPFEQADGTHTRDYEGLGLGLSLVRRIVEAHGGRFGVESILGNGSTFWCDIPVSPEAPAPAGARPSTPRAAVWDVDWDVNADHGAPEEDDDFDADTFDLDADYQEPVVFVDHDLDMLRILRIAFQEADMAVATISAPQDVLDQVRSTGARIVFVDVGFPQADGVELCRQLKTDPDTADIPVYMFTGHNGADVRARARAAGADGFIAKPVALDYLIELAGHHA